MNNLNNIISYYNEPHIIYEHLKPPNMRFYLLRKNLNTIALDVRETKRGGGGYVGIFRLRIFDC